MHEPSQVKTQAASGQRWDAGRYDSSHSFIWRYGEELIELLAPQPGERILDLGCGTGHLTHRIAESGARVLGLDRSAAMLAQARRNYPALPLVAGDATRFTFTKTFDAVFSNAVLHWIMEPEKVIARVAECLRPGGRFVLEMGGRGNIGRLRAAVHETLDEMGYPGGRQWNPKFFPSAEEFAAMLGRSGFSVESARLFERPTPLAGGDGGCREWLGMFEKITLDRLPEAQRQLFITSVETKLRPLLYRNGQWTADYVRLRVKALRGQL